MKAGQGCSECKNCSMAKPALKQDVAEMSGDKIPIKSPEETGSNHRDECADRDGGDKDVVCDTNVWRAGGGDC